MVRVGKWLAAMGLAAVLQSTAHAVVALPAASATIDWSTFTYQVFSLGNPSPIVTFSDGSRSTTVAAGAVSDGSGDWTTPLSAAEGVAQSTASVTGLSSAFLSVPATANVATTAYRQTYFTLSANSYIVFSVAASTSIDMNAPVGGAAYAWSYLTADGPDMFGGADDQNSTTNKISWAAGAGAPVTSAGTLHASFSNLTGADLNGHLIGVTNVTSYGATVVTVVPEPDAYTMLLAGFVLMSVVAGRRRAALRA